MSKVEKVKILTPINFEETMKSIETLNENKKVICLFTGPDWCPDCVTAEPIIMNCLEETTDEVIFVECLVERGDYKGNAEYFYRTHPKIKLTCIPTLMDWSNPRLKLDDKQCADQELVRELMGLS